MKYIREKKTRFGAGFLDVDLYEMNDNYEPPTRRAKRKRISPPHILAANDRHSRNQLRQLIVHNFGAGDYYLTPTYSGKAPSFEEAQRHLANFVNRLKRLYVKHGSELKAICVTEGGKVKDKDGNCTRVHHHIVVNGGVSREEIGKCWQGRQDKKAETRRGYCNTAEIYTEDGERGCERIAEYMAKSRTKAAGKGMHRWNATRNIKRPVETIIDNKFSRKRTDELLDLVRVRQAVKQEQNGQLRRLLEKRYDRECIDVQTVINPVTGRIYISARFRPKEEPPAADLRQKYHIRKSSNTGYFPALPLLQT